MKKSLIIISIDVNYNTICIYNIFLLIKIKYFYNYMSKIINYGYNY